jgi:hypothetical protein
MRVGLYELVYTIHNTLRTCDIGNTEVHRCINICRCRCRDLGRDIGRYLRHRVFGSASGCMQRCVLMGFNRC